MAVPKFITVKGASTLTSTPYYTGLVQHESVMTKKSTYAHLAEKLAYSAANIRATFLALAEVLKENAAKGNLSYLDDVSSIRHVVKGAFDGSSGPWVKGRNYLTLASVALDPFKSTLGNVIPLNRTEGVTPAISSVLDNTTGVYDVIAGTNPFTIAGTDLGPDTSKTDEYVGIISEAGVLTKAVIATSALQTVKASFATAPTPGNYTLVVATRSGLGSEFGVRSATRKVVVG